MSVPLPGRILPAISGTFRALRHRDFRVLWLGQIGSLTGSWMQSVAQGWLVLRLTDSAFFLGLIAFCNYLPFMLFSLPGGVLADRVPRRSAMMCTQSLAMLLSLGLALLTGLGWVRVWHVAVLAFGLGTVTAIDVPVRQSLLPELVGRGDLQNAIALNSMAFNGARLVGPAIGGLLVAAWGETLCFALNAASFLIVLLSLIVMRSGRSARAQSGAVGWRAQISEVLRYTWRTPQARAVLLLVVVTSVFGAQYAVLLPAVARDVLAVGAEGLGLLMASAAVGALCGAVFLARRRTTRRSGRIVATSMSLLGLALIVFSYVRVMTAAAAVLLVVGAAMLVQLGASNAFLQLLAPPELRGRIVSLYMLAFVGMAPIGSLLSGSLARWLTTPRAIALGGSVCLLTALIFAARIPRLRRATPWQADPAG